MQTFNNNAVWLQLVEDSVVWQNKSCYSCVCALTPTIIVCSLSTFIANLRSLK